MVGAQGCFSAAGHLVILTGLNNIVEATCPFATHPFVKRSSRTRFSLTSDGGEAAMIVVQVSHLHPNPNRRFVRKSRCSSEGNWPI